MEVTYTLFNLIVVAELMLGSALLLTLSEATVRIWPPPGRASWQYWFVWTLTTLAMAAFVALGIADWNSFVFGDGIRFLIGGMMIAGGLGLVAWGIASLGIDTTTGLEGELIIRGAFQYTRNPQYVGEILWILGYSLLTNSALVLITALLGCALFWLMPFTEEPWLRDRYGEAFDEYAAAVPRFVGRATPRA